MNTDTKRVYLENAYNVRDLGGFRGDSGKIVRWNAIFRSDGLANLNGSDWDILLKRNVRTILDLRSGSEIKQYSYDHPALISYIPCPLQKEEISIHDPINSAKTAFGASLTEGYVNMINNYPLLLVSAIKLIVDSLQNGSVLFHCTAGKDRTGVLAATIYTLLGVDRDDIVADYQVSYTYNKKGINKLAASIPDFKSVLQFLRSDADTMEELLDYFEKINLSSYLISNGLDISYITKLKELMLI
ncbi:MAG: tyrosine-protein phosphatase [Clostridia bacterium]